MGARPTLDADIQGTQGMRNRYDIAIGRPEPSPEGQFHWKLDPLLMYLSQDALIILNDLITLCNYGSVTVEEFSPAANCVLHTVNSNDWFYDSSSNTISSFGEGMNRSRTLYIPALVMQPISSMGYLTAAYEALCRYPGKDHVNLSILYATHLEKPFYLGFVLKNPWGPVRGFAGITGTQGTTGYQGITGLAGYAGYTGLSGISIGGTTGVQGPVSSPRQSRSPFFALWDGV